MIFQLNERIHCNLNLHKKTKKKTKKTKMKSKDDKEKSDMNKLKENKKKGKKMFEVPKKYLVLILA